MAGRAPRKAAGADAKARLGAARFAVVAARFHEPITRKLADGAVQAFVERGIAADRVDVHWVPGCFELPLAAQALAATGRYAGVACVGVVIRGGTPHWEHVTRETAAGIREAGHRTGVPVTFGVITALDEEQAWERAGGAVGHRGDEAAAAAHEMADFLARLAPGRRRGGRRG